jgi:hypothetical protein
MDILVQIVIGMAIGWRSLLALNDMGPATHHGIRILHLVLGTLGAWIALAPLFPDEWGDVPKLGALATYLMLELVNRRRVIA